MIVIPISTLFIGIFVVLQIPLTIMVGYRRARTNIHFFDGGDQALLRRMLGRVMHAAILILKGWGLPRAIGMILTFLPMLGFGIWCLSRAA